MKKLEVEDFKIVELENGNSYLSYDFEDGREMCLEACMNGFDVALYDRDCNLLKEKMCTDLNMKKYNIHKALAVAVKMANMILREDKEN